MKKSSLRLMLMAFCVAGSVSAYAGDSIEEANRAYHVGEYAYSLSLYEGLAAQGSAEAAERAGFMLLQANGHYGPAVRRDLNRARALILQAAKADRPGAAFLLNMLEGTD